MLVIVSCIAFVDMLGIGLILPVAPQLIGEVAHVDIAQAAGIGGFLMFSYAAMQFLFAPIIGGLSDRFGRRPILLTTLFLLGIDYGIMAVAPSLWWLLVGRTVSGIMGATRAASNACIADCVPVERRGAAFGVLSGAGAIGFVLGPIVGGLAGEIGTRIPFAIASSLALVVAFAGLALLKETLPRDRRRRFDVARANPLGSMIQMAKTPFLLACLLGAFFMQLSRQAHISIWAYWGKAAFGWTPLVSGMTISLYGILLGIVQALLTGRCIARYGAANTARYSLMFGLPSYFLLAFAPSTGFVIVAIVIGSVAGLTLPALQSIMTARVEDDAQGELQGAVASTYSLTAVIGPVMMAQIFGRFADRGGLYFPGAPYLVSIVFLSLAIAILWRTLAPDRISQAADASPSTAFPTEDRVS
jgi:MFS transporter, DHA1 family, tetracycline resistance protein